MKSTTKKVSIALFSTLALALSGVSVATVTMPAKAEGFTPSTTYESFKTEDGAWLSTENSGMRFVASISKADYKAIKTADADAKFGMAIARVDSQTKLQALATTHEDAVHFEMDGEKWDESYSPNGDGETYKYGFVTGGIAEENYAKNYTVCAYVEVGGVKHYSSVSSDTAATRSPLIVAINYANAAETVDTFVTNVISAVGPTLTLDSETYTLDGTNEVAPTVTVGNVVVDTLLSVDNTEVVDIVNGKLVAKGVGTTTLTASIKGVESGYTVDTATVSVTSTPVSPTISREGILTLDTKGEVATVTVSDGTGNVVTKENVSEDFDLYDAILDYREGADVTESKSYTVTVASESYKGVVTTAEFVAIGDMATMQTEALNSKANSNKYYYLTNTVELIENNNTSWLDNQTVFIPQTTNVDHKTYMTLDGRGYSLKLDSQKAAGSSARVMFHYIQDSLFKNLMIDMDVANAGNQKGIFSQFVLNTTFENCYFNIKANNLAAVTVDQAMIRRSRNTVFNNCIFNLVDVNTTDNYDVTLASTSTGYTQTYNNCAVLSTVATKADLFDAGDVESVTMDTLSLCASAEEIVAAWKSAGATYSDAWTYDDETSFIKFFGADVFYYGKTPAFSGEPTVDGIVTLATEGSAVAIKLCDEAGNELTTLETAYTGATYDAYTAIADYRIANDVKTDASYIVKFESSVYGGQFTTAKIGAISTLDELKTIANAHLEKSTDYYYLANDIAFATDPVTTVMGSQNYLVGTKLDGNWMNYISLNIDGRGNGFVFDHLDATGKGNRVMFQRLNECFFKNLVVEYNFTFSVTDCGMFAYQVYSSTFNNCYFDINVNITAQTGKSYGAMVIREAYTTTFNNCIFNLNDMNTTDERNLKIIHDKNGTLNNCSIINNFGATAVADVVATSTTVKNSAIYDSLANLVATESANVAWNGTLQVTASGITLCGKEVATVTQ